jgi:hypothetical protein
MAAHEGEGGGDAIAAAVILRAPRWVVVMALALSVVGWCVLVVGR